jgi:release factor glutamine methyltransferase
MIHTYSPGTIQAWRDRMMHQAQDHHINPHLGDWLLREVGGLEGLQLRLLPSSDRPITLACSLEHLDHLWGQHLRDRTPVQYLAGFVHWWRFRLQVAPGVLIPRPETELILDWLEQALQADRSLEPQGHWVDLGTGSGALALGLATLLPQATIHGVDRSAAALTIAQANAQALGLGDRIQWHLGDWFEPLNPLGIRYQGIVANPPYIPRGDLATLPPEVRDHEPTLALDGGTDGLRDLRHLITTAPQFLAPGGVLLLEMMAGQGEAVGQLLAGAGCYQEIQINPDWAGLDRLGIARYMPQKPSP